MCSPHYNPEPAGPIRAAEASVVKKPSIAGEMSVGMGIWRDNGGKCSDAREWGEMSRLHMSHVSPSRANVFSNHVFGGVRDKVATPSWLVALNRQQVEKLGG